MKRVSIYLLAVLMILHSFAAGWILAGFHVNRDFIAKSQCENRFVAESTCKGQCVLMKKLKEQQKKEKENPEQKLQDLLLLVCQGSATAAAATFRPAAGEIHLPVYLNLYQHTACSMVFHPPLT